MKPLIHVHLLHSSLIHILVYIITDLCLGGELFDRICRKGNYYESDAANLVRTTCLAVDYLHDHGIVHRDLKPENLLFRTPAEDSDLLIADFGLSRIIDDESFHVLTTTCGTPGYMAPEIFKKSGHGKPVDIWALGVIAYFLLSGYPPFDRDSPVEEMQAIMAGDYSFDPAEFWIDVSEKAKGFIRSCLTVDPEKRWTVKQCLAHPWLSFDQAVEREADLLPTVRSNFNARRQSFTEGSQANSRKFHVAVDAIKAINIMRSGLSSNGALAHGPKPPLYNLGRGDQQPQSHNETSGGELHPQNRS